MTTTSIESARQRAYELAVLPGDRHPLDGQPGGLLQRCTDCGCFLPHEWQLEEYGYGRHAEYTFWIKCSRCGKIHTREV